MTITKKGSSIAIPLTTAAGVMLPFFLAHTVEWMPTVHQVLGTLPTAFQDKFPTMYLRAFVITDDSEIFNEMPSDLHMQSSMWSGVTTSITALPSS